MTLKFSLQGEGFQHHLRSLFINQLLALLPIHNLPKLDSSFHFATFRMTFSACHSEVVPEAGPPSA